MYDQLCSLDDVDDPSVTSPYLDCDIASQDMMVVRDSFNRQEAEFTTTLTSPVDKALPRTSTYEKEKSIDDFAELDAWLNSGAVIIL